MASLPAKPLVALTLPARPVFADLPARPIETSSSVPRPSLPPPPRLTTLSTTASGSVSHAKNQSGESAASPRAGLDVATEAPSRLSGEAERADEQADGPPESSNDQQALFQTDFGPDEAIQKERATKRRKTGTDDTASTALALVPVDYTPIKTEIRSASTNILPLPLPSKRFKKTPTAKAVLIPVEQLPVYPLPPPPPITDPILCETVFTHSTLFERTRGRFEDPAEGARHYEKLEHVGDSLLGMIVTTWLHETKPTLTCGTASKLKSHLVSNATLSHLSGLYNFPHRLKGPPDQLPILRAQTDVRAALMEAYIAGVYFSYPVEKRFSEALGVLDGWLREMFEPLCDFFYSYMKSEYEQFHLSMISFLDGSTTVLTEEEMSRIDKASQGMANLLRMYCQRQDRQCRFEEDRFESHCGILWRLRCYVDEELAGVGMRTSKRMARNVAAWEACKRFELTKDETQTAPTVTTEEAAELTSGIIIGSVVDVERDEEERAA